jgi:hypothetical protein
MWLPADACCLRLPGSGGRETDHRRGHGSAGDLQPMEDRTGAAAWPAEPYSLRSPAHDLDIVPAQLI